MYSLMMVRDLLDALVFDICGLVLIFREAFHFWKSKFETSSSDLNWVQVHLNVSRVINIDAFSLFLKTLNFSCYPTLNQIFACKTC